MNLAQLAFQPGIIRQPMSHADRARLLDELPEWHVELDGHDQLVAAFPFKDFDAALAFAQRVGAIADRYNHHPELVVTYGRVIVKWWTHTAGGVTGNDFVLARETSRLTTTTAN